MNRNIIKMLSPKYNCVILQPSEKIYMPFRIIGLDKDKNETIIYQQDELSAPRYCFLTQCGFPELYVECEENVSLQAKAVYVKQEKPFRIHEYIVTSESLLTQPLVIGEKTTDLILIGQLRCDQDGNLVFLDKQVFDRCYQYIKEHLPDRPLRLWSCLGMSNVDDWFVTEEKRKALAQNALAYLEQYGFDGLDIDWEYPETNMGWKAFSDLIVEIKNTFVPSNKFISAALAPWGCYFTPEAVQALDIINSMIYDLFDEKGCHESFHDTTKAIRFFRDKGFADEKILVGIGFYGRPSDKAAVWRDYIYFFEKYGESLDPNCNLLEDVYFNGQTMCMDKTALALYEQVGGLMIWHHESDISLQHPLSLMKGCYSVIDEANE